MSKDKKEMKEHKKEPPEGWTRCHAYMERKKRFCRQQTIGDNLYCANHQHLSASQSPSGRKRIPCPIDPSHLIFEDKLEKHRLVCPRLKQLEKVRNLPCYRENINTGGFGPLPEPRKSTSSMEWAQRLALKVLEVYQRLFGPVEPKIQSRDLTMEQMFQYLSMEDYSEGELKAGLPEAVDYYRMKSGGERHLHQQASLVGHLRKLGVFDTKERVQFLEMGAGRGMLGLVAAGVAAANEQPTHLTLVERSGSRSKADTALRSVDERVKGKDRQDKYLRLGGVKWLRVQCDLSHVHMPTVLEMIEGAKGASAGSKRKLADSEKIVVIAKHLCGAGTDLALRSLKNIAQEVDVCVMATCCHGVCSWNEYVGRQFLITEFGDSSFGPAEFEMLRKWSSGTVDGGVQGSDEHASSTPSDASLRDPLAIPAIVTSLNLVCGPQGLGRACQRILDAGRINYMETQLFPPGASTKLCHYVSTEKTPQNAVLVGSRLPT